MFFHFCLEQTKDFGVSMGILQTLSKLTPHSLQTHMFSFVHVFVFLLFLFYFFLDKRNDILPEYVISGPRICNM